MRLSRITVVNFRNFSRLDVRLAGNIVVVGENRVGKSNLLYALRLVLDPGTPCSRHIMQTWLRRAKKRLLEKIEDADERAAMRAALKGMGFHAQKRYGVRAKRNVPPKVLEALARTRYKTLMDVYDYVDAEEMRPYLRGNGDPQTETQTELQAHAGT